MDYKAMAEQARNKRAAYDTLDACIGIVIDQADECDYKPSEMLAYVASWFAKAMRDSSGKRQAAMFFVFCEFASEVATDLSEYNKAVNGLVELTKKEEKND